MTWSERRDRGGAPAVLCAGIAVQDLLWRVEAFPPPAGKAHASEFRAVAGGCAANAAIAIARLGGRSHYAGPLGGPRGADPASESILADLEREGVDIGGVVRVDGATVPVSGILIDDAGERMIATFRDARISAATPPDATSLVASMQMVLVDNRLPDFVTPICDAARRRGIDVVIDADKPTSADDPLLARATHLIFSAECLRGTTGEADLATGLRQMRARVGGFLAVSNGPDAILYLEREAIKALPVFRVEARDTLAAGDVFHAGFALSLAEGHDEVEALRFGAAAAALKCTRFGGSAGAPTRGEVEALLSRT